MANLEHLAILQQGVEAWNQWREENLTISPDLSGADLSRAKLNNANLSNANLIGVNLQSADLIGANLRDALLLDSVLVKANLSNAHVDRADLRGAFLMDAFLIKTYLTGTYLAGANLSRAKLIRAILHNAYLGDTNLSNTDLRDATLINVDLREARFIDSDFSNARLIKCNIYGISVWNVNLKGAIQKDLIISADGEPTITVDNLEVAQFIYLLLNNQNIRGVIETITTKAVLILGRFSEERKAVLDGLREALRHNNYLPIMFDSEKSENRNFTETVRTLAHLSRFVIADITDPKSIPQELQAIVPNSPRLPVQPIILAGQRSYAMFEDFYDYRSVLPLLEYENQATLLAGLASQIIGPAEAKAKELLH